MRTFVAVLADDELAKGVSAVQNRLKRIAPAFKWVQPRNLHVTLKFLGSIPESDLPMICSAVREATAGLAPFEMSLKGFGAFPNSHKPRVLWVGIEIGKEAMVELARKAGEALQQVGFAGDDKPFKAHITIGRARDQRAAAPAGLVSAFVSGAAEEIGSQMVRCVAVMTSDLTPSGPVYMAVEIVPLGTGCRL